MILWKIIAYSALAGVVLSLILFYLYTHPRRYVSPFTPSALGLPFENVKLKTADGVELAGWYIPNKNSGKAVVACHGYPMDKGNILGMVSFLAGRFNLLLFDFRAMGESEGFFTTGGARELKDLDAAAAFLKEKGFSRAGLFGFSMGAAAALMTDNPAFAARAADSPFADIGEELRYALGGFGIFTRPLVMMMKVWSILVLRTNMDTQSPLKKVPALKTPVLIIHGNKDTQVPFASSLKLKAACTAAELWIIDGADHGQAAGVAGPAYEKRLLDFFEAGL